MKLLLAAALITGFAGQSVETFAYAPPIGEGDGPFSLTDDYQQKAIDVAHVQAAVAGARLDG